MATLWCWHLQITPYLVLLQVSYLCNNQVWDAAMQGRSQWNECPQTQRIQIGHKQKLKHLQFYYSPKWNGGILCSRSNSKSIWSILASFFLSRRYLFTSKLMFVQNSITCFSREAPRVSLSFRESSVSHRRCFATRRKSTWFESWYPLKPVSLRKFVTQSVLIWQPLATSSSKHLNLRIIH